MDTGGREASMTFNPGENVGPYRIIEQLGQGGMATVFKAYHPALDRYVALKVLHPAFSEDPNFEARFQREARVVAKLEHPNIVPVYDYAEHEHRPYLVMKFIEGETLKARISRGPLTSTEIRQVVDSVGSALGYAHKQGILHRDIKPSNVLISTDGVMYLADFGLARIAQAGESTLSSDSIMGTPQYISPEQAMGKSDLDAGTDLYSFGVMLYEMVVGQVPFNADTPFSIIHDHIYSPLPMPRIINHKVPETVELVLLKALAKERSDRYDTVESMMRAFKDAWSAAGIPMQGTAITLPQTIIKAPPPPKPVSPVDARQDTVTAKKPVASRPWPWLWVGAVLLLLFCVGAGALALARGGVALLTRRAAASTTAVVLEAPTFTPAAEPVVSLPTALPPTPVPLSPAIATAQENARLNPQDPTSLLDLSLAYWDSGQKRLALESLNGAADLADQDRSFLTSAAFAYTSRQAWIPAAAMNMRLVRTYPPDQALPPELADALHESVYRASSEIDVTLYIGLDAIERIEHPLGLVARGRYHLANGNLEEAQRFLNQVRTLKPDFPEATLLEAEIMIKQGRIDEARQLLTVTASDLGQAGWLLSYANDLLKGLPQ
jgi:serine/threonine protein kinase/Flp pilus assembly protein TadD